MKYVLSILLISLISACATNSQTSGEGKARFKEIPTFQASQPPQKKFVVIRSLKDDGAEAEEDEILAKFLKQARKLGGDALLVHEKHQSGTELAPFSFGKVNFTYLYRADVIRFE
jgi:hypothetical protein